MSESPKRKELLKLSNKKLIKECKKHKIATNGSKADMVNRLIKKLNKKKKKTKTNKQTNTKQIKPAKKQKNKKTNTKSKSKQRKDIPSSKKGIQILCIKSSIYHK